eukprot:TRINITY_DN7660_c0_g1_i2.p1 TRINITY_DN7660_c0_g1~~TRINITY_DN7660_c0_g1_i2.p1  ORF type:complete len:388 (+),score=145.51 TRINITY_DN7660_c0_g1_i2:47-1210(+)
MDEPAPVLAEPEAVEEVAQQPGLLWVLLTRLDGFVLTAVLLVAGFLLMRTLATIHKRLESAQKELLHLRSAAQRPAAAPPAPPPQPPPSGLIEENMALQRRSEDLQRETFQLRQKLAEAEQHLATKADELNKLYALVTEAGDESVRLSGLQDDMREARVREQGAVAMAQRAQEEAAIARARADELQAEVAEGHARAQQLDSVVAELTQRLRASEEKVSHSQTVWDMMVQQYGLRPDPSAAQSGPLGPPPSQGRHEHSWGGSATPSPSHRGLGQRRSSGAVGSVGRPVSPHRDADGFSASRGLASAPASDRSPHFNLEDMRFRSRPAASPLPRQGSPQPPGLPRAPPPPGKWYNTMADDDSQTEYLQSLERQIEMLQQHMDSSARRHA